jgi:hypothetical protein
MNNQFPLDVSIARPLVAYLIIWWSVWEFSPLVLTLLIWSTVAPVLSLPRVASPVQSPGLPPFLDCFPCSIPWIASLPRVRPRNYSSPELFTPELLITARNYCLQPGTTAYSLELLLTAWNYCLQPGTTAYSLELLLTAWKLPVTHRDSKYLSLDPSHTIHIILSHQIRLPSSWVTHPLTSR